MSGIAACALGVRQAHLDAAHAAFFREARPWAFILFAEACVDRAQVRRLVNDLRHAVGREALVFIDQEGGRIARLKAPEWPLFPPAARFGALYARDPETAEEACWLGHRLIAQELKAIGVDGDYAPVLDVPVAGADPIIGDRAFAREPAAIAALARQALAGLHAGGVVGCIKHIPGHGRATADSHLMLPRVTASREELACDLAPFKELADAPTAMTAHIVYEAYDAERPATCSPEVIRHVIRGEIGFKGLLMSDDLDMKALTGPLRRRAEESFAAGCDVILQCNGVLADMHAVAEGCPTLSGLALTRAHHAESIAHAAPESLDVRGSWDRFASLVGPPGAEAMV